MESKFLTDPNAMAEPWCESPFFSSLIVKRNDLTTEQRFLLRQFNKYGFVKINLELTDNHVAGIISDMYALIDKLPKQAEGYHYNDSPRLFEGWRDSKNILELSLHKKVFETLRLLYGREPIPFQTINFIKGTEQPLHSDTIHFHTLPHKWVTACWVALERIDIDSGPLKYVPSSHRLPIYTFQDLNLPVPDYGKQFDNYRVYEEFIFKLKEHLELESQFFLGQKGEAIIWAANLLHGGSKMIDPNTTRLSQVTHYYFEGCQHYYCPMFSDPSNGIISKKDLSTKKFT